MKAISSLLHNTPVSLDQFCANLDAGLLPVFGEKRHEYKWQNRCFVVHACEMTNQSTEFNEHLNQIQSLAFWFIDGVNYTDHDDPLWTHFVV